MAHYIPQHSLEIRVSRPREKKAPPYHCYPQPFYVNGHSVLTTSPNFQKSVTCFLRNIFSIGIRPSNRDLNFQEMLEKIKGNSNNGLAIIQEQQNRLSSFFPSAEGRTWADWSFAELGQIADRVKQFTFL